MPVYDFYTHNAEIAYPFIDDPVIDGVTDFNKIIVGANFCLATNSGFIVKQNYGDGNRVELTDIVVSGSPYTLTLTFTLKGSDVASSQTLTGTISGSWDIGQELPLVSDNVTYDNVGWVTLNDSETIKTVLAAATYSVTVAVIEPALIQSLVQTSVSSISLYNYVDESNPPIKLAGPLTGLFRFDQGFNCHPYIDTASNALVFDVNPGNGLGNVSDWTELYENYVTCSDIVNTINGLTANANGALPIVGGKHLLVTVDQSDSSILHITLADNLKYYNVDTTFDAVSQQRWEDDGSSIWTYNDSLVSLYQSTAGLLTLTSLGVDSNNRPYYRITATAAGTVSVRLAVINATLPVTLVATANSVTKLTMTGVTTNASGMFNVVQGDVLLITRTCAGKLSGNNETLVSTKVPCITTVL